MEMPSIAAGAAHKKRKAKDQEEGQDHDPSRERLRVKKAKKINEEERGETAASTEAIPFEFFYHLAHKSNLESIRKYGLLSTSLLLNKIELEATRKMQIIEEHRPKNVILPGGLVIRDQSPMPPNALSKVLPEGMVPSDWYRLMNSFLFLWPDRERVERHRHAHGGDAELVLLVLDAKKIIQDLPERVFVSPINSGFALRKAAPRSEKTFVPSAEWLATGWPQEGNGKRRPRSFLPVEIAIKDSLPLDPFLISIE